MNNPGHFYMLRSHAPVLVSQDDVMDSERSEPVDQRGRKVYGERFIHGKKFAARPDLQSVVQQPLAGCAAVYRDQSPFQALGQMAAFLDA